MTLLPPLSLRQNQPNRGALPGAFACPRFILHLSRRKDWYYGGLIGKPCPRLCRSNHTKVVLDLQECEVQIVAEEFNLSGRRLRRLGGIQLLAVLSDRATNSTSTPSMIPPVMASSHHGKEFSSTMMFSTSVQVPVLESRNSVPGLEGKLRHRSLEFFMCLQKGYRKAESIFPQDREQNRIPYNHLQFDMCNVPVRIFFSKGYHGAASLARR